MEDQKDERLPFGWLILGGCLGIQLGTLVIMGLGRILDRDLFAETLEGRLFEAILPILFTAGVFLGIGLERWNRQFRYPALQMCSIIIIMLLVAAYMNPATIAVR